jgi:hypothetical protein
MIILDLPIHGSASVNTTDNPIFDRALSHRE